MEPIPSNSPPDWSLQTDDIHCPMCDYNLRGLIEPRCPECGFRFDWNELLDAAKRVDERLYEFTRRSKLTAFRRTLIRTIPAWRFWNEFNPAWEVRPKRLQAYYWLCMSPMLVLVIFRYVLRSITMGGGNIDVFLDGSVVAWGILATWVAWTQMMYYCFIVLLPTTTLNAKLRTEQLWRTVVYCYDAGFWLGLSMWAAVLVETEFGRLMKPSLAALDLTLTSFQQALTFGTRDQMVFIPLVELFLVLFCALRLRLAYSRYLRLPHPDLVIIAFQIVSFLFLLAIPATLRWLV